jgi:hypothetical protein
MCCEIACRVEPMPCFVASREQSSNSVCPSRSVSSSRIARRVGSASALNTSPTTSNTLGKQILACQGPAGSVEEPNARSLLPGSCIATDRRIRAGRVRARTCAKTWLHHNSRRGSRRKGDDPSEWGRCFKPRVPPAPNVCSFPPRPKVSVCLGRLRVKRSDRTVGATGRPDPSDLLARASAR